MGDLYAKAVRICGLTLMISHAIALDNGVGRTPPMGYNTWNDLGCDGVGDAKIRSVVDKMSSLGLKDLGYQYVNIDDCWARSRDEDGLLVPIPDAFPNGIKGVADYVHQKGFKFGLYTDRGTKTCAEYPGSLGHERLDARILAKWGVDYLKHDSCNAPTERAPAFQAYTLMRDELNATGRSIYFSMCGWHPWYAAPDAALGYLGGAAVGNSWRISYDVVDWSTLYHAVQINSKLAKFASPGSWNDPDMLIGSSPGTAFHLLPHQSRTQFSLWSVMAAPLLIGSKLDNMSAFDLATYTNKDVIRVNQDLLGRQGVPVVSTCPDEDAEALNERQYQIFLKVIHKQPNNFTPPACYQVWKRVLASGDVALVIVNFDAQPREILLDFAADIGIPGGSASFRDVWTQQESVSQPSFHAKVPGDGHSIMLLLTPITPQSASAHAPDPTPIQSAGSAGVGGRNSSATERGGSVRSASSLTLGLGAAVVLSMAVATIWLVFQPTPRSRRFGKRGDVSV
eukprot:1372191-Rhodomonas_salina.1